MIKKILIGLLIFYLLLIILRFFLYGWHGFYHLLIGPFYTLAGVIEGLIKGVTKS
ncbi:MAG: hypothetical protein V1729_05080 [Candidatus Woesearchaeota archaeon]